MKRLNLVVVATSLWVLGCAEPEYPAPPPTRVATVVDTLHGVAIPDDYRWLEDQGSVETREWIAAQNAYAETVVGESPLRDQFRERLRELIDRPNVGGTRRIGDFEYFTMRREGEEAPIIYRRPAPTTEGDSEAESAGPQLDGEYEVFIDPFTLDPDYRRLVSLGAASPDGRYVMIQIREGGSDEVEYQIRDLVSGSNLPDYLPRALYGGFDWDEDSRGFRYTHRSRFEGPRIRHHVLGTPFEDDEVLWGEEYGPTAFISINEVGGGRYRLFSAQHGWAGNDWFIQDLEGDQGLQTIVEGLDAHSSVTMRDGRLWIRTDLGASNYRLVTADPAAPSVDNWVDLIPEGPDVLMGYSVIDELLYVTYLADVADRIEVFDMEGQSIGEVPVSPYSTTNLRGGPEGSLRLTESGYLRPGTTFALDPETGERTLEEPSEVPFDTTGMVVVQHWFTSEDGTRAPMYVMHKEGLEFDGTNPTILSGYGGFNSPSRPGFSNTRAAWVEMGGVWAVATLRGGSEYGEDWHRAGMLTNKANVFADFVGAAERLVELGYTSPAHLGISGGSNGGLLVASAMTQRPDLFAAVLCTYPDLDMVRFYSFQETNNMPALLEYGDARIAEQFEAILAYSPYQAVTDGVDYPAVMLTTGDLDTRVSPLQARRMTARLQAATGSGLPVVLWYDSMGGHAAGRGRPVSLAIEDSARELTFMAQMLGLEGASDVE